MVKESVGEAYGYTYQATSGGAFSGFKSKTKVLRVILDDKGVVSDVDYTASSS